MRGFIGKFYAGLRIFARASFILYVIDEAPTNKTRRQYMAKILIASIGTGQKVGNKGTEDKKTEYLRTKYFIPGNRETIIETPMILSALTKLYNIDKLIVIGTAGSDWPFLYEFLHVSDDSNLPCESSIDNDYHAELTRIYEQSRKQNGTILPVEEMREKLMPLRAALGDFCASICVMHYGIGNDELISNLAIMHDIAALFKDGDEIYFDISHSFRSLPFYELLAINLAKQTMRKNVHIAAVSYGMLDARLRFDDCTPIVDLSLLVNVMDWMKAVEEFNRFGSAYLLADLLKNAELGLDIGKEERKALNRLGDIATGVELTEFKNLVKNCVNITKNVSGLSNTQLVIGHIFKNIADDFGDKLDDNAKLYAELAKRHYTHKRYIQCVITLSECMFDFCAELLGVNRRHDKWDFKLKEMPFRNKVYNVRTENSRVAGIIIDIKRLNSIRNHLAHGGSVTYDVMNLRHFTVGMSKTIDEQLEVYTKHFCTLISNFRNNADDMDALRRVLENSKDTEYSDMYKSYN